MEVTMHRFVLAEFNTHRKFSRNSASSRAIPVERRLHDFQYQPAYPVHWPREQSGMQGGDELTDAELDDAQMLLETIHDEVGALVDGYLARHPMKMNRLHKSVLNRVLEPFLWHTVLVTSTEWNNFFDQRCSPLAQPEMRLAAEAMRDALASSAPRRLWFGEWHLPYVEDEERSKDGVLGVSAARSARLSYLTQDGKRDWSEDVNLFNRLVTAAPPHASPLEHVATPAHPHDRVEGNFDGWHQLRHWRKW